MFIKSIVFIPLFIKYWGTEKYGFWVLLVSLSNLIQLINNCHLQYVGNIINLDYNNSSILKNTVLGYLKMNIYIFCILLPVLIFLSQNNIFSYIISVSTSTIIKHDLSYSFILLSLSIYGYEGLARLFMKLLEPLGLLHRVYSFELMYKILELSIIGFAIYNDFSIINLCKYLLIISILNVLLWAIYVLPKHSINLRKIIAIKPKIYFSNFITSQKFLFKSIIERFYNDGINILIIKFINFDMMLVFSTTRTMVNFGNSLVSIFSNNYVPYLQKLYRKDELEKLKYFILSYSKSILWLIGFFVILSFEFVEPLFMFLTKDRLEFNYTLYLYLCLSVLAFSFGNIVYSYYVSINNFKKINLIILSRVVLFLLLFMLLPKTIQNFGIAIASGEFLGYFILCLIFLKYDSKLNFNLNLKYLLLLFPFLALLSIHICFAFNIFLTIYLFLLLIMYCIMGFYQNKEIINQIKSLRI